jgi:hypothetical protein
MLCNPLCRAVLINLCYVKTGSAIIRSVGKTAPRSMDRGLSRCAKCVSGALKSDSTSTLSDGLPVIYISFKFTENPEILTSGGYIV